MTEISREIARLLQFGRQHGLLESADCAYAANRMLVVLGLESWDNTVEVPEEALESPAPILDAILDWAYENGRLEGNTTYLVDAVSDKFTENAATATGKLGNMMAIYWPYNYDELQVNPNLTQNPAYPEAGDSYESTN